MTAPLFVHGGASSPRDVLQQADCKIQPFVLLLPGEKEVT
jgi:hypothetical protein